MRNTTDSGKSAPGIFFCGVPMRAERARSLKAVLKKQRNDLKAKPHEFDFGLSPASTWCNKAGKFIGQLRINRLQFFDNIESDRLVAGTGVSNPEFKPGGIILRVKT